MQRLQGRVRDYPWGSFSEIPAFFGFPTSERPVAELWLGAHQAAPAFLVEDELALAVNARQFIADDNAEYFSTLENYIAQDPQNILGDDVIKQFGEHLPFLLKLIAPAQPLSLQVHPSKKQAMQGYWQEEQTGIPLKDKTRNYRDLNHKPEMVYALSRFDALVGFRSPRRIKGVLQGLNTEPTNYMLELIRQNPNPDGVREAFSYLLSPDTRPSAEKIAQVVQACADRDPATSPSARADAIVQTLAYYYPSDAGVVASLLLNPVTLNPGETLFVPVGTVHAYLRGFGVEIMANSDNVLRAGLTSKHINTAELLSVMDTVAAPPIRIAPERVNAIQSIFYAPVGDFELSLIHISSSDGAHRLGTLTPRILLCLSGQAQIVTATEKCVLHAGQAIFLGVNDGRVTISGEATVVQADVP